MNPILRQRLRLWTNLQSSLKKLCGWFHDGGRRGERKLRMPRVLRAGGVTDGIPLMLWGKRWSEKAL